MSKVFAIDVGGVLGSKQHDGSPVPYSLGAVKYLYEAGFELWIVSMCGKQRAIDTVDWLRENGFDRFIPDKRQIYIPFKDKNKNARLNEIGANYFIDDRLKHIVPAFHEVPTLEKIFHMVPEDWIDQVNLDRMIYTPIKSWYDVLFYLAG